MTSRREMETEEGREEGTEEEREEEREEEDVLVAAALVMSYRLNDNEWEAVPYDFFQDEDYVHQEGGEAASLPEEFQQLAQFFAQMMEMGQDNRLEEEETIGDQEDRGEDDKQGEEDGDDMQVSVDGSERASETRAPNALHHAVFQCDVNAILLILDEENKKNPQDYSDPLSPFQHSMDLPDHCGNTPLLLAIKLGYVELAKLLIAEGFNCDVTSSIHITHVTSCDSTFPRGLLREGPVYHLMDECILLRDIPLIKSAYKQLQLNTYSLWLQKKRIVMNTLLNLPDFYVELNWEFAGSGLMGPVVKMFAPYDTYRIWKKGNWLRLDSTIEGIHENNFKVERSYTSLIFQGSNSSELVANAEEGELYVLNRKDLIYERMLRRFSHPSDEELNLFANQMVTAHIANRGPFKSSNKKTDNNNMKVNSLDLDADNWSIKPITDRKGSAKTVRIPCEQRRDVYSESAVSNDVDSAALNIMNNMSNRVDSRLCYKWVACGHVKASVANKTSRDAHDFHQLPAETYFGANWELPSSSGGDRSSVSKWSKNSKGTEKSAKRQPKPKEIKRKVEAALYMVKDYPIALSEILPVLDIFAMKNEYIKKLVTIFNGGNADNKTDLHIVGNSLSGENSKSEVDSSQSSPAPFLNIPPEFFPYRIQVPIVLGISALATFENFQRNPEIDPALFLVNTSEYSDLENL